MSYEQPYIVVFGQDELGRRVARRLPLPSSVAHARHQYDELTDRALSDIAKDVRHEQHRRKGTIAELGGWDPESTQRRNG